MIEALLVLLIAMGILTLQLRDLVGSVILMAVFSLLSCLIFYMLHAPDVALTEAAVGSGVGTLVFIWVVLKTERRDTT